MFDDGYQLRRRIKTEEQAKVVAAVWGTELIQFLASPVLFHQDDLKNRTNGYLAKWSTPYQTIPPYQNGYSPKNF